MVRRKITIEKIENPSSRHVTFSKRRVGLFKKAHDLSVLCDADVAAIVFSSNGKPFQFASSSLQSILERYTKRHEVLESPNMLHTCPNDHSVDSLTNDIDTLKMSHRNMAGDDLEMLSLEDLVHLEQHIYKSIGRIHAKKDELLIKEVEELKEKVTEDKKMAIATCSHTSKPTEAPPSQATASVDSNSLGHLCPSTNLQELHEEQLWTESGDHNCVPKRPFIMEDLNCPPECVE